MLNTTVVDCTNILHTVDILRSHGQWHQTMRQLVSFIIHQKGKMDTIN